PRKRVGFPRCSCWWRVPMFHFLLPMLAQQRERAVPIERTRSRFGLDEGPTRCTPPPAIGGLCLRPKPLILTPGTDTARIVTNGLVNRVDNGIFHEHDVESLRHPCPSSCRQPSTACSTAIIEPAMSFPSRTGAKIGTM